MARLSAENDPTPSTPTEKRSEKQNRFKKLFKSGHSRARLSTDSSSMSPRTSSLGIENQKPGFEKVGLHPSERSRVLDLDEWEKLKEENKHLSHPEKIQLYKRQEDMKQLGEDASHAKLLESPASEKSRHSDSKAMKVLGIGDAILEGLQAVAAEERGRSREQKRDATSAKAESLRKACEGSSSESGSSKFNDASSVINPVTSSVNSPVVGLYPALRPATRLTQILAEDLSTVDPTETASNMSDHGEDETTHGNPYKSERLTQEVRDAIDQHEFRFHQFGFTNYDNCPASNNAQMSAADRIRAKIFAELGTTPNTEVAAKMPTKIGPILIKDHRTAVTIQKMLSFTGTIYLLIKAIQGPQKLFWAIWNMAVCLLAYETLRQFTGWNKDGSSDVLLTPVNELGMRLRDFGVKVLVAILEAFAHAVAKAVSELDSDDCS
ncbi:hypothetical protein N0V90_004550 [Kalmusia sp. IMI 367209]|nr:hypothetical protein N0V90_004550 [Kalmusia sp. IMI 367209]